jgi:hypothetical protein
VQACFRLPGRGGGRCACGVRRTLSADAVALADESKAKMYELHASDPDTYTVEKLAADYGLRYQRVMAILTLKKARAPLGSAALRFVSVR